MKFEDAHKGVAAEVSHNTNDLLKTLCDSDSQLLDAAMFVIMLEPSRQIPQLGGEDTLIKRANSFEENSDSIMARVNYETLARISFYRSRADEAKQYITKCEKLAESGRREKYQYILQNFDRVFSVVKRFYQSVGIAM